MKNLGLQLWSIRDNIKTEDEVKFAFSQLAKFGYNEIETAGKLPVSYERYAEIAKEEGLRIISTHFDFGMCLNDIDRVIEIHKMYGAKFVGTGGLCWRIKDHDSLIDTINVMNDIGSKLKPHGLKFVYHNHAHEFMKFPGDNKSWYDYFIENIDPTCVSLETDVAWIHKSGSDVCTVLEKIGKERLDIVHIKDMGIFPDKDTVTTPNVTECGNGNINFKAIIPCCEKLGVEHFIVEQDGNWAVSPLESARVSAKYLLENF